MGMELKRETRRNTMFESGKKLNLQVLSRRFILIGMIPLLLVTGCNGNVNSAPENTEQEQGGSNLSVSTIDPAKQAIGVSLNKNIIVTLNTSLQSQTIDNSTVFITNPGGQNLSANVSYNDNSRTITLDPSLPLGGNASYTVTVTTGVKATNNTSLASNYTATFTTLAGDLPPEFALWESNMIANGDYWGNYQNPNGGNGFSARYDNAYYDILWNMYQIKEYTGQEEPWNTYIAYARSAYRDEYYRPSDYNIGDGHQRFSHGLLADYLAGGTTTLADIQKIRDNPAFSDLSEFQGSYDGQSQSISREMAYVLQANVNAEKAGESRNAAKVSQFIAWMENHLYEWRSNTFSGEAFFQPFMFALTAHALIEFYDWEVQNGRNPNAYWPTTHWPTISDALAEFSSWLYNDALVRLGPDAGQRMWVADFSESGYGGFRYADREYEEGAGAIYPGLNLLTSPVYMWVYKITGDVNFRNMGDVIFKGGVPYGNSEASGKEFDQNYRWSFKFIQWRSEADQLWQ
jgi:hypothetical protein